MKLGPITKLDKRNTAMSRKNDDEVMSVSCDVFGIFPVYGQFGAIRKPYSTHDLLYYHFSLVVIFLVATLQTLKTTKKPLTQLTYYFCE